MHIGSSALIDAAIRVFSHLISPRFITGWVSLSLCFIFNAEANATSALYLNVEEQAKESTAVVIARVYERTPIEVEAHRRPMQQTRVVIDEILYGQAPQQIQLVQIGGTRDGLSTSLPGDGVLHKGDRAVLFLRQDQGKWYLTALSQSVYYLLERNGQIQLAQDLQLNLYRRDGNGNLKQYHPEHNTKLSLETMRQLMRHLNQSQEALGQEK
ncbi:MAG: hypothetical protein CMH60_07020 [Myxococcales bacterium]|nr:hypothetical protein [Myxococcales bacterium]